MTVHIDFRKWPDSLHWQFSMNRLGEDAHGTWLWAPAGIAARRGHEEPIRFDRLSAKVVSDGWWTAIWSVDEGDLTRWRVYVDIIAPAEWHGETVRMVDLDLDVYRTPDGRVRLLDEDEFAEHQVSLAYPLELVENARRAAGEVLAMVREGVEPFGRTGLRWLEAAVERAQASAKQ